MRRISFLVAALVATSGCAYSVDITVPSSQPESTRVYAADGSLLATLHAEQNREHVRLRDIARVLQDAVIAIEDDRFFTHRGVDVRGIARAATRNVEHGGVVQGGSTITQQYVKNVLLQPQRTGRRKVREAILAYELERKYTKRTILERYLNTIYLGNGAYGAQAAAATYFGRRAADVTLPQAALLAGVIQAPERFDPFLHPDDAKRRRDIVLGRMQRLGVIHAPEATAAIAAPLGIGAQPQAERYPAGHFVEKVKRFVLDDPRFGATPEARRKLLFQGGLLIQTTLDPKLQAAAEDAVAKTLSKPASDPAAALVSLDPRSGYVRAFVGGRDFFGDSPDAKFDLASQARRQTGSAFKPFVLAAALESDVPLDRVYPAPPKLAIPLPRQPVWNVDNYEGEGGGSLNLVEATVHSVNTVFAQLIMDVGPRKAVDLAAAMGIRSPLQPNPSAVLGTNIVTVLDMASAYSTFAADGMHSEPVFVTKISRRDGTLLYERPSTRKRVLPPEVARHVNAVLQEVVNRGTGVNARLGRPVAGKTGTAQRWKDAWFVGFTPEIVTAVWVGFPKDERSMKPPLTRITVTGGTWPAQIWQLYDSAALAETPVTPFIAPAAPIVATTTTVPPVTVPPVTGLDEAAARSVLERAGFHVDVLHRPSRAVRAGIVMTQTPPGDSVASPGSTVTLTASSGPPRVVAVPNVLGHLSDEATAAIEGAGLVARVVVEAEPAPGSPARHGRVWKQSPPAGAMVDEGSVVRVSVNPGEG